MASRGRPRHPDILTPREWEVLELLRFGASNAQIAERLGITKRTAKFHVSEILSKLGVAAREEAASLSLPERRRWWAAWPLWARIAGAATVAAAAAGLAVLAWGVLRTGGPTDAQQASARPDDGPVLASAGNPVAWIDAPETSAAKPFTIPGVPPCRAADLVIDLASAWTSDFAQSSGWGFGIQNNGAPCFLGSTMDVGFAAGSSRLSVSAERVGYHIIYLENGPRFPGISQPAERFTYSAYGSVYSAYGSLASRECSSEPVTQLQLSPGPGLGTVALNPGLPYKGWGRCVGETYRADLHAEGGSEGSGYSVQTELDAPAVAHPGEPLRFLVTLRNERPVTSCAPPCPDRSPAPLEWPQCPSYHQELEGVAGSFSTHRLNCQPVNPMPPYARATFEMYIDVPADAQPGPSVLSFGLDEDQATYQQTAINVWIEP